MTVKMNLVLGLFLVGLCLCHGTQSGVGYRVGKTEGYKLLRSFGKSALYQVQCSELDDGRPIKLIDLHGTHFEAGYAYGKLMSEQINFTYHTFFKSVLQTEMEIKLIEVFLDWQYEAYVRKQLPLQFLQELQGLAKAGKQTKHNLLAVYFERVLVISSFPGAIQNDIMSILGDELLKKIGIKSDSLQAWVQDNYLYAQEVIKKFIKRMGINCSFFAVWGSRTADGKLYSMRNLDWEENTGVNKNKLVTVWNIDGTIPHLTLGYPGILGALTGMSGAGLTVHEAGLSSHYSTELGFQWTLRMRYIMMHAHNLSEALTIWKNTNNTLGMNFMIASASDLDSGHPAVAMETMRAYTAYFRDYDSRENATMFIDPSTHETYQAGHSMTEAIFRTNHAYDPTIRDHLRNKQIPKNDDSMIRYLLLSKGFSWYESEDIKIDHESALNLTAIMGDKGSEKFQTCQNNFKGLNVVSVTYDPAELVMWTAFQYGFEKTFRSACCGVYVEMDMKRWLRPQQDSHLQAE